MEFFRNPRIDFLGKKKYFVGLSVTLVILSAGLLATRGLTYGIDFRGGADVILRFHKSPGEDAIRTALEQKGVSGSQIQRLTSTDAAVGDDILIRIPPAGSGDFEQGDVSGVVIGALRSSLPGNAPGSSGLDVNLAGEAEIVRAFQLAFPGRESLARDAAAALTAGRNQHNGIFASVDEAAASAGMPLEAASWLRSSAGAGSFAIRSVDYVGASVGKELKQRATYAIIGSLIAMLFYVAFRFDGIDFGVSAILTLAHDAMLALGAVCLTGKEFDLTVLAAILTVVGYSVNDTIVIFDRVRENMRLRRTDDVEKLFNDSINQTLGRTILTSLLVLMVVLTLWLFGGARLNPFSFTLLIGVICGSYSTIYVSSPIVIWWRKKFGVRARA